LSVASWRTEGPAPVRVRFGVSNSVQRFETVNDLYRRATGFLRPGKSVAPECGYDGNSEENQARFENWVATRAFTGAVDRIAELEKELREHRMEDEALRDILIRRLGEGDEKATVDLVAAVCNV
jgi:hypothetical protein